MSLAVGLALSVATLCAAFALLLVGFFLHGWVSDRTESGMLRSAAAVAGWLLVSATNAAVFSLTLASPSIWRVIDGAI